MKKTRKIKRHGFILEIDDEGKIISLALAHCPVWNPIIKLGQKVKSNGRMFIPVGTRGVVMEIFEPFICGRTDDVIGVLFSPREYQYDMKLKDLDLE